MMCLFADKTALRYFIFALTGSGFILWQLLSPGYLLLLDWIAGPITSFPYSNLSHYISAPSNLLIYFLSFTIPAWMIQKILLIGVVFSLFYIPLVYFPWKTYRFAHYFTALFAAINPFVYERLLAGQWRVLVGYVCLFTLVYYLFQYCRTPTQRNALYVFSTLLFTGFWSIHFLAIGIVITIVTLGVHFGRQVYTNGFRSIAKSAKHIIIAGGLFIALSLYWIIPVLMFGSTQLENFTGDDYSAFTTTRDPQIGVVLNVLTLRGFWATGEAWGEQFKLPGDMPEVFYPGMIALIALAVYGWYVLGRAGLYTFERYTMLVIGILATIFATSISAYGLWQINYWMLEHVPFWNGFRDAQKWAGVIAVLYALCAGIGIATLIQKFPRSKFTIGALGVLVALAISPYQLFGLAGQVTPVWYPQPWSEVNTILQNEPKCTAVFLPWHQYYAVKWNNGQLVGNPATRAFNCTVYTSQNTELGEMKLAGNKTDTEQMIETAVINNQADAASIANSISLLKAAGVQYIIYTDDITGRDIYLYPLLTSPDLTRVYDSPDIQLYKIN